MSNELEKLLLKYPEKPWNWGWNGISRNPNITMEIIEKHPEKPWDWNGISRNPNITMEFIERYPEKPWSWYWISKNPNITMEFIEKHPEKPWAWFWISCNKFEKYFDNYKKFHCYNKFPYIVKRRNKKIKELHEILHPIFNDPALEISEFLVEY